jgi:ribosomal protein S18 acetylase RimI-like enzyme
VRLAHGQAKRARSVNAVYPSTAPLDAKIAYCEELYRRAGLPAIFRMTPFSQPDSLDAHLERRGYERFETTAVELATIDPARLGGAAAEAIGLDAVAEAVGALRGSPASHREAHRTRLAGIPLERRAVAIREDGRIVACGLTIVEDGVAGLFDIITDEAARRRGHARTIVVSLLRTALELGARHAYLQVKSDNEPARRLYRQFGFEQRYEYWYRGRPGQTP